MNLCITPVFVIPKNTLSLSEKLKIVEGFLQHPNATVKKSAIAAYIMLSAPEKHLSLYQKYKNIDSVKDREAAALGFYNSIYGKLEDRLNILEKLQFLDALGESSTENLRDFYLNKLISYSQTSENTQRLITTLSYSIDLFPTADCYYERALLYNRSQIDKSLAIKDLESAIALAPNNARYYVELAELSKKSVHSEKALYALEKAYACHNGSQKILQRIADTYLALNKLPQAQKIYTLLLTKFPVNPQVYLNLVHVFARQRDYELAKIFLLCFSRFQAIDEKQFYIYPELSGYIEKLQQK